MAATDLVLPALILAVSLYGLYKIRRVHLLLHTVRDQGQRTGTELFRQLEALQGLYVELDLKHSLPATRGWAASPDFLLELTRHARTARPSVVLECSSGVSTLVLARCLQRLGRGKVYSLEHDPHYARQTRDHLVRLGLQDWAHIIVAPLRAQQLAGTSWTWYDTEALSAALPGAVPIDLLVIDGPPGATGPLARYPAGPLLFPRLALGATVFLDDAARVDERAALQRWGVEFPALEQSGRTCEKGCAVLTVPPAPAAAGPAS